MVGDSKKLCTWEETRRGYQCIYCKTVRTKEVVRVCKLLQPSALNCAHIGPVLDSSDNPLIVKNCGCATAQLELAVFECSIHQECLPTYVRGDLSEPIQTCISCPDFKTK